MQCIIEISRNCLPTMGGLDLLTVPQTGGLALCFQLMKRMMRWMNAPMVVSTSSSLSLADSLSNLGGGWEDSGKTFTRCGLQDAGLGTCNTANMGMLMLPKMEGVDVAKNGGS